MVVSDITGWFDFYGLKLFLSGTCFNCVFNCAVVGWEFPVVDCKGAECTVPQCKGVEWLLLPFLGYNSHSPSVVE